MSVYYWQEKAKICLKMYYCESKKMFICVCQARVICWIICCFKGCRRSLALGCYRAEAQEETMVEGEILTVRNGGERLSEVSRCCSKEVQFVNCNLYCQRFYQLTVALRTGLAQESYSEDRLQGKMRGFKKLTSYLPCTWFSPNFSAFLLFPSFKVEGKR